MSRVRAGTASNSWIELYTVVFTVRLEDAIVSFPLEVQSYSKDASQERAAYWQKMLSLPSAT